jgi:uncharacterized protein (TIGR04222 family)
MRIRVVGALALFLLGAVTSAGAAHAASAPGTEHIATFDVKMTVAPNGLLSVHEVIGYNFGVVPRHGIFRDIPVREVYTTNSDYQRVYRVHVTNVQATSASAQTSTSTQGNYLRVRIGDPDTTVTGLHTYTIDYTVEGALNSFRDHDELYWDAIGNQFDVPFDAATIAVSMPAEITRVACFAGPQGSGLGCDASGKHGKLATFAQQDLSSNEGVTVVVAIPSGAINPPPAPILEKKWNLNDAFSRRYDTMGPAAALAVVGLGAVVLLVLVKGRDRRYKGSAVDQAMGNTTGEEERVPIVHRRGGPVEFVPPDEVRPGEVGVLADETANLLDVTATIVDLAVRGYLRITELPPEGLLRRRHDYELTALDVDDAHKKHLLPYEQKILSSLFKTGPTVKLSELKYKFRADLSKIRDSMYQDAVKQGWFRMRPDHTRAVWHGIGLAVLIIGVVVTFFVARSTSFGLVPLAIVLVGLAIMIAAHRMPSRTGKGSAMLSRVRGFRRLFDEGDEDLRSRFAEQHGIFSEYLPYAIVFGCTHKWAKAFEGLDAEQLGSTSWYGGHANLDAFILASALDDFGTVATGTLYASQPSSSGSSGFSGGFSGGGGGGGGGGSW